MHSIADWFHSLPPWLQTTCVRALRTALQSFVAVAGTTLGAATIGPDMPWSSMMTILYGFEIALIFGLLSGLVSFAHNALECWLISPVPAPAEGVVK